MQKIDIDISKNKDRNWFVEGWLQGSLNESSFCRLLEEYHEFIKASIHLSQEGIYFKRSKI